MLSIFLSFISYFFNKNYMCLYSTLKQQFESLIGLITFISLILKSLNSIFYENYGSSLELSYKSLAILSIIDWILLKS